MTSDATTSPLHQPAQHESGYMHVSGAAIYFDDIPTPRGLLYGYVVCSPIARGRIVRLDVEKARAVAGVEAVLTADDIPGINDVAPFTHDEPLLAKDEVFSIGQSIVLIVADTQATCRKAAAAVEMEFEELPAHLDIRDAIAADQFLSKPHIMRRGDVDTTLADCALRLEGEIETGGQDHFYLESQAALAIPDEDQTYHVHSSTQHPSEVQAKIAEALGLSARHVVVEMRRMGGGFGGKETQAAHYAVFAAMGAYFTKRPVKVWLNRDQDMLQTGKRHPFYSRYEAGFDKEGNLLALRVHAYANGGWTSDLSGPILDRCMFHLDSSYYIPNLYFEGRVVRTNVASNTAFRGFGGPQGMVVTERVMNRAADALGIDPAEIRRRNFYGEAPRNMTPYYQEVSDCRLERIYSELLASSDYAERRKSIDAFNTRSRWHKRGIGFQPVKFGISFTNSVLNQAGALVLIYADGSVQLNHGGTEMGQGLHTKMLAICAHELGIPVTEIRQMPTITDKIPNTSATAASAGSDLNGQAVREACLTLRGRLQPVAAKLLGLEPEDADRVRFANGQAYVAGSDGASVPFHKVSMAAYMDQISLSATGFYRTPDIAYDASVGRGKPFHYYAYGGAVLEVEVNGLTGEHRLLRADILHDVGNSLVPSIDRGQIEGGFVQGHGWLTCEELIWDDKGYLRTHSPDTYKIPAVGEAPADFRVELLSNADQSNVIHGSKAVGEPPFMLAIAVVTALRHAVRGFAHSDASEEPDMKIPCTPEAVLRAVEAQRKAPAV